MRQFQCNNSNHDRIRRRRAMQITLVLVSVSMSVLKSVPAIPVPVCAAAFVGMRPSRITHGRTRLFLPPAMAMTASNHKSSPGDEEEGAGNTSNSNNDNEVPETPKDTTSSDTTGRSTSSDASVDNEFADLDVNRAKPNMRRTNDNNNNGRSYKPFNNNMGKLYKDMTPDEYDRAVRKVRAQVEIDRIKAMPDAPFDKHAALQDLPPSSLQPPSWGTSANSGSNNDNNMSKEQQLERALESGESALYKAIAEEDLDAAAKEKEQLDQLHLDDCGAVLQANAVFYKAFSKKSYELMADLWLPDNSVICIHPSHKPLVGAVSVLDSWKQMFQSKDAAFQTNWMDPTNVKLSVRGTTAILTCDEHVYSRRFKRGQRRHTELVSQLTATNIFRKVSGKWHMVHHHASWHADSPAAKLALNGGSASSSKSSLDNNRRTRILQSLGGDSSGNAGGGGDILGSILGLPGMEGADLGTTGETNNGNKPAKRIIMGSLSDLFNGGLNDILNDSNTNNDVNSNSNNSNNNGEEEGGVDGTINRLNADGSRTIIHFSSANDDEEDGDDDDDDYDEIEIIDDDDEDDDDDDDSVSIMQNWPKNKEGKQNSDRRSKITMQQGSSTGGAGVPKDALRQNCISALRKLSVQGSISPKQKRLLLTDIITCSAKGEFSMVEVAYELLCGEGEDKDAAEEEFADQCRVFASSLPDSSTSPL